ncbi:MAG: hypothetical protein KGK00_18505, partial [Paracoccaceae bacterium]|nr:hypothetical protein [Paracoccaceae bacterium]
MTSTATPREWSDPTAGSATNSGSGRTVQSRRCTLTAGVAALSYAVHVGTNRVLFEGRVSPTQRLKPGAYVLTLTAGS